MKKWLCFNCIIISILSTNLSIAQDSLSVVNYQIELGVWGSNRESLPFWIKSNQFGEVPSASNLVTIRGQIEKKYSAYKKLDFGYKVRGVVNQSLDKNTVLFSEAFIKAKYKLFEIYLGRRRNIIGLTDTTLSSGSFIWSGNSLAIPKLQISTNDYIPVFKSRMLYVNATYAHGLLGSSVSTKHYFLHQKSLYFKVGKASWKMKVYGGINHQVQWGGRPDSAFVSKYSQKLVDKYPSAYGYVISGLSTKNKDFILDEGGRIGNHLGTIDVALEFNLASKKILVYKQSIFEKGNFSTMSNISDGIYGLSVLFNAKNKGILKLNFEVLNTQNQGGDVESKFTGIASLKGQMDYFNNVTYRDGWTYKGNTIGTPFLFTGIQSPYISNNSTNTNILTKILNNRVKAYIIGVDSKINKLSLRSKFSFSSNLGTYTEPINKINQISLQQQFIYPIKKEYVININLGYDSQGIFNRVLGAALLIQKTF